VLRFWETRFIQIKPLKRGGGRRYYRPDDVELLRAIRQLLYGEGYTIKGVQKILKEQGLRAVTAAYRAACASGGERMALIFGPGPDAETHLSGLGAAATPPAVPRNGVEAALSHEAAPSSLAADEAAYGDAAAGLDEADLHRLEALLNEIAECERILQAARRV
jgi:DNA-binding transcriptional MerR regulator